MSAPDAAASEPTQLDHGADETLSHFDIPTTPDDHEHPNEHQQHDDDTTLNDTITNIKNEDDVAHGAAEAAANETETTLRPDPQPSSRRRESEAADTTQTPELGDKAGKKRKRGVSPPWQFPTVDRSTLKTADGRRISTRVNANTPVLSESESGRPRSASQSVNQSRAPSPPWKQFKAERPTTIQIDGKRKSGRVNKELTETPQPKRVSPRTKKTVDKAAGEGESKSTALPTSQGKMAQLDGTSESAQKKSIKRPRSQSPSSRIAELQAQIAALKPTRSFPSPELESNGLESADKRKRRNDATEQTPRLPSPSSGRKVHRPSDSSFPTGVTRPSPRIKLRFSGLRQTIPPPHPNARASPPARPPKLSLHQLIEGFELQEMQQPYTETERGPPSLDWFQQRNQRQAAEEGSMRRRLLRAQEPGNALSAESCSLFQLEEPPPQLGHGDHLTAQALRLRQYRLKEKTGNCALAKKVAHEALEYWKAMRGPTEEDLIAQQDRNFRLIHKQVVLDVRAKWDMVAAHVQQLRKEKWEREEEARRQERLQKQLEQAELMVAKQRGDGEEDSDVNMDEDSAGDVAGSETGEEVGEESEEENMSEEDSEDGEEAEDGEMSEEALAAYLAQREAEPPDKERDEDEEMPDVEPVIALEDPADAHKEDLGINGLPMGDDSHEDPGQEDEDDDQPDYQPEPNATDAPLPNDDNQPENDADTPMAQTFTRSRRSRSAGLAAADEAADAELSDDESIDMYDSDEDMSSTGDEADAASQQSEDDDANSSADETATAEAEKSIFGMLFSSKTIKDVGLPTPTTSAEGDARDCTAELVSDADADGQAEGGAVEVAGPDADHAIKEETMADADGVEAVIGKSNGDENDDTLMPADSVVPITRSPTPGATDAATKAMVPIPALLRGTLRSYQHAGVDWLVSLHRNGTNGILADEMGLGKTIQTIALLAHLAEEQAIWDPHLVIVPTSVILNWVTEFQKFLPGFRVLGYYGTSEERQQKRKGWVNDPHHEQRDKRGYNVVITSYNVAMQDINAIRNVQWHYLVLDEAHNIRNFNSQRWQVLIRLKTQARLLLTGTPLQNSLTELWSLLTFLTAGDDNPAHGDLEEFLSHWKEPVKEIFDRGVSSLSTEAQKVVDQLHVSLRPFLLRRLKSEVEKDLPKKTESVVVCKLSKRQRQLYQEYMGLASTRESLTRGNAVSAGKVLLSLRRVCNHPDLFDPRPIQTSFAMEKSPVEPCSVKERLVRGLLAGGHDALPMGLMLVKQETRQRFVTERSRQLAATGLLRTQVAELEKGLVDSSDVGTLAGSLVLQRVKKRERKLQHLRDCIQINEASVTHAPMYGSDLRELLTVRCEKPYSFTQRGRQPTTTLMRAWPAFGHRPLNLDHASDRLLSQSTALQQDILSLDRYAENLHDIITRFAFCTPVATAPVLNHTIPSRPQQLLRASDAYPLEADFAHEARARTSIVFPDSRLLVYDSGKLQQLTKLLRELQAKGSRSLIFTQMTGTLNILEQFLNLLNLPYLRLDGSTPVERRQLYASEFNRPDSKYQCMILSSRAGGVGLNLIGASSVIFYDLDWNPQMDRQCMDRAHRIGQVRDVEVYKMVSEKTVEENILRRANQKSLLDQTVIQEGHFTTEHQQPSAAKRAASDDDADEDDVAVAIERFLGGGDKATNQAIESVEDKEDVVAAQNARKEEHQDDDDFAERSSKGPSVAATPAPTGYAGEEGEDAKGHVDDWMISLMQEMVKDVKFLPPPVRKLDRHGRDPSHRPKRKR